LIDEPRYIFRAGSSLVAGDTNAGTSDADQARPPSIPASQSTRQSIPDAEHFPLPAVACDHSFQLWETSALVSQV